MKLHEITDEIQLTMELLVEADGQMTPEVEAQLGQLESDLYAKTDGYCKAVRILETHAAAAQAEIDRLARLVQARSNSAKRLKEWLKQQLERLGMTRVETDLFVIRTQANGRPSINYSGDAAKLPEGLRRTTISVDGDAAYKRWKEAGELPEGFQVVKGSHLRIS